MRANMRTFEPVYYDDEKQAMEDVRNGRLQGAVIIPPQYSRTRVRAGPVRKSRWWWTTAITS